MPANAISFINREIKSVIIWIVNSRIEIDHGSNEVESTGCHDDE